MKEYLRIIKNAIFGKDMRGAIHDAINEMHNETCQNTTRQDLLEKKYDEQIKNIAGSEVQSAEVVDARCGFDTLGSVIKQKVYHFENVEKMKNCLTLLPGDVCETLGYYEANDGGGARYVVRLKGDEDVEDGGSIHFTVTKLVVELIIENNTVNIKQFGAIGDGIADDTIAIKNCFEYKQNEAINIKFGKNKTYLLGSNIWLFSNKNIDLNNSEIKITSQCYLKSNPESVQSKGYTGVSNFLIKNGTINGNKIGVMFPIMHGNNIEFDNIKFLDCVVWTHLFDLGGCNDVRIKHCKFIGSYLPEEDAYREIIQTDYAGSANMPYWSSYSPEYDNIPTKNVIIDGCIFEKGDGTYYPCAIGTHSTADINNTIENIQIINNVFNDFDKANIRFHGIKNLLIDNNVFNNSGDITHASDNVSKILITPLNNSDNKEISNIYITNNKFYNEYDKTVKSFIQMSGNNLNLMKNIYIENNIFKGNYDGVNYSSGIDFMQISGLINLNVNSNYFENIKNSIFKLDDINIDEININNNVFKNCRDYWRSSSNDTLSNTTFTNTCNNSIIRNNQSINTSSSNMEVGFSSDLVMSEDVTRLPINSVKKGEEFINVTDDKVVTLPYYLNKLKIDGQITLTNSSNSSREYTFELKTYNSKDNSKNISIFTANIGPYERATVNIPTSYIDKTNWYNIQRTLYCNVKLFSGDKIHSSETKINISTY